MTRWYANAGVTYLRSTGALGGSLRTTSIQQRSGLEFSTFGRNPNDFVNLDGRLVGDVGWQDKLQGVVRLPCGLPGVGESRLARGRARIRTRAIPASVAGQSSTDHPAAARRARTSALDHHHRCPGAEGLRAGSRRSACAVFLDALNLNNENAPQAVVQANVTSSSYQFPTTFVAPRRFMLSGNSASRPGPDLLPASAARFTPRAVRRRNQYRDQQSVELRDHCGLPGH